MHNQSDYGYAVPQIEARSQRLCIQRALLCRKLNKREWVKEWLSEARIYREWELRTFGHKLS